MEGQGQLKHLWKLLKTPMKEMPNECQGEGRFRRMALGLKKRDEQPQHKSTGPVKAPLALP